MNECCGIAESSRPQMEAIIKVTITRCHSTDYLVTWSGKQAGYAYLKRDNIAPFRIYDEKGTSALARRGNTVILHGGEDLEKALKKALG